MKMSAIRERTVLCVIDLPKKLTSRRNLHAHFSKFGEIKSLNVSKSLQSGIIHFLTHFDAQSAKTQGINYEGKNLKIFWSEGITNSDPRSTEDMGYEISNDDQLWEDDNESFGIETIKSTVKEERRQSAKDLIKQHLAKTTKPGVKQRLGKAADIVGEQQSETPVSPTKQTKTLPKLTPVKKNVANPTIKRKIHRKSGDNLHSTASRQKKLVLKMLTKSTDPVPETKSDLNKKLALLDERDKLIRKRTVHDSNIKTAAAIKGTCPDMCPERERILRQCRLAVATYEMIPGTNEMDENKAVKEYTRSSADQEVPLPYDLRPGPVLSLTMDYLITSIITKVDQNDENKAVWYSFCWNRLRSIRKDIILQQLCNMETVRIVEQCARFHICCYDHMWGAEISGFDDKINTQNLIDCLQTLKHLYEDLSKRGISCPNEPEFYLYLILLKLRTGDVMWEYQQYSLDIRLSPQVQFGIEAYMAFKNNMYSKYFTLVKKGSYLTACLMQRYFEEVRTRALKIMIRAYCLPNKSIGLLSSFLVSSLKFDSQKNALRFCESHEVDVKVDYDDGEEDEYISTSSFIVREKRLPIANAVVGEGNPLPVCPKHQVSSSFDDTGNLKSTFDFSATTEQGNKDISFSEVDQSDVSYPEEEIHSSFKFSLSPTKKPGKIFDNIPFSQEASLDNYQKLVSQSPRSIDHTSFGSAMEISVNEDNLSTSAINKQEAMEYKENIFHETPKASNSLEKPLQHVSYPHFLENTQFTFLQPQTDANNTQTGDSYTEQDLRTMGKENKLINTNHSMFIPSFQQDSVNINVNSQKSPSIHQLKPSLDNKSSNIGLTAQKQNDSKKLSSPQIKLTLGPDTHFCESVLKTNDEIFLTKEREIIDLPEKLLKEDTEKEKVKLQEIARMEKIRKQTEIDKYNKFLRSYVRQRFKIINTRKYARQWKKKIEKLKETRADFPLLFQLSVKDHISKWGSINSIPTRNIFFRARDKKLTKVVVSQLLSSGITDNCKYIGSELGEVLAKSATKTMRRGSTQTVYWKLGISVPWDDNQSSDLSVFNQLMKRWCKQSFYKHKESILGSVENVETSLEVPVKISINFSDSMKSSDNLQGMDALIFVVPSNTESNKSCIQRLHTLVSNLINRSEFSIAVINVGGNKLDTVLNIELEELYKQNLLAHWKIFNWTDLHAINESLIFLANQVKLEPEICVSSLQVLMGELTEEFFDALNCSYYSNEDFKNTLKNPNTIILLYNTCLFNIEKLLTRAKFNKICNIAEDFKGHIPIRESGGPELLCGRLCDHEYTTHITKMIYSMKLPEISWPTRSLNRLVKTLKSYCNQVCDLSIFPQSLRMLSIPEDVDIVSHLEQVSWLNIVEFWVQNRVQHTFSLNLKRKTFFVVFNKNDVKKLIKKTVVDKAAQGGCSK